MSARPPLHSHSPTASKYSPPRWPIVLVLTSLDLNICYRCQIVRHKLARPLQLPQSTAMVVISTDTNWRSVGAAPHATPQSPWPRAANGDYGHAVLQAKRLVATERAGRQGPAEPHNTRMPQNVPPTWAYEPRAANVQRTQAEPGDPLSPRFFENLQSGPRRLGQTPRERTFGSPPACPPESGWSSLASSPRVAPLSARAPRAGESGAQQPSDRPSETPGGAPMVELAFRSTSSRRASHTPLAARRSHPECSRRPSHAPPELDHGAAPSDEEAPLNLLADVQWILFPRATDKPAESAPPPLPPHCVACAPRCVHPSLYAPPSAPRRRPAAGELLETEAPGLPGNEELLLTLRKTPLLACLSDAALSALLRAGRVWHYPRYSSLGREGTRSAVLAVVLQGQVGVLSTHPEFSVAMEGRGASFWHGAIVTDVVRDCSVGAWTECRVLTISRDELAGCAEAELLMRSVGGMSLRRQVRAISCHLLPSPATLCHLRPTHAISYYLRPTLPAGGARRVVDAALLRRPAAQQARHAAALLAPAALCGGRHLLQGGRHRRHLLPAAAREGAGLGAGLDDQRLR